MTVHLLDAATPPPGWAELWDSDPEQHAQYALSAMPLAAAHRVVISSAKQVAALRAGGAGAGDFEPHHLLVSSDAAPVAGLLVTREDVGGCVYWTCYGRPLRMVWNGRARHATVVRAAGMLWARLAELASEERSQPLHLRDGLVGGQLNALTERALAAGASAIPGYVQTVDLRAEPAEIMAACRENLRRQLKSRAAAGLEVAVAGQPTETELDAFRRLHKHMRGEEVRGDASWNAVLEASLSRSGYVVLARQDDELIAACFFSNSNRHAYYEIGASSERGRKSGASAKTLWLALLEAKQRGCSSAELGERLFDAEAEGPAEKWARISHFLTGFGTRTAACLDVIC